ncbi:MAG: hypothetical protein V4490_00830 [Pseudomonadota bacterium]
MNKHYVLYAITAGLGMLPMVTNATTTTVAAGTTVTSTQNVSANNSLIVFGTINISGGSPTAIHATGNSATVTINDGALIYGSIVSNNGQTNDRLYLNYNSGSSYVLNTTGPWTIVDYSQGLQTPQTGKVAGIGAQETADKMMFQRTTLFNSSLAERLAQPSGFAAPWMSIYHGTISRSTNSNITQESPFNSTARGLTIGAPIEHTYNPMDFVFNIQTDHEKIAESRHLVKFTNFFAGVLAPGLYDYVGGRVSGKLFIGFNKHDGTRTVFNDSGSTTSLGKYHSLLVLAGLEERWSMNITKKIIWTFLTGADLVEEHQKWHYETLYFSWKTRRTLMLSGKLEGNLRYQAPENLWSAWGTVSLMKYKLLSGKRFIYQVNGGAENTIALNNKRDNYIKLQAGADYDVLSFMKINASLEWMRSRHHIHQCQGHIGIMFDD